MARSILILAPRARCASTPNLKVRAIRKGRAARKRRRAARRRGRAVGVTRRNISLVDVTV